ncbi:non-ribosomal peptide synthetase [Caldimonas brevitalea]|uniref:Long-chain-fatty-acid--CoA ligase n=1 Tax=Caldimonas brevitalea TaxID=413882 RepID=A0A0G3BUA4_9BURK|nr:non-ribosomal peptide synthetase [Caldimonas brevitalea]AKJ30946.1 long-chain-fatty-acid--CoA ligase [Caldimonas brevitalea]
MTQPVDSLPNFYSVIRHWAAQAPQRLAFNFLADGDTTEATLTYGELDRRARAVASVLQARGWADAPVLLQYRPGLDFIVAFFGCLYAGSIAVPAYPPTGNRSKSDRLQKLVASCGAVVVLTNNTTRGDLERDLDGAAATLPVVCTDALGDAGADDWRDPQADRQRIAFLQYSSGSTGDPKGVVVTHGNLMHNQATIRAAMGNGDHTVFASWLPLFHDMGLIGNVMQPLYLGVPCHLMPPMAFLQKPLRWLKLISEQRVTCTGGPNFAYDLCVDKISDTERASLDLSSWQVAYNGSEPVRAETLRRFADAYAPHGLAAGALYPCYGLAEGTLFVTGPEPGAGARVLDLDARALESGLVRPAHGDARSSRALTSCGRVWGGQSVLVVDAATRTRCADGQVGEIWLQGESITGGYWQRPDANAQSFATLADAADAGRYCRTGDLGFFSNGELYVTGRLKEMMIVRGRNHYPQDIEHTVQQAWPGFVRGGGAAFVDGEPGRERLVLVQEIARTALRGYQHAQAEELAREAVALHHGLTLSELVPIKPATLAKTSSGKIRRDFMRTAWRQGELTRVDLGLPAGRGESGPAAATLPPHYATLRDALIELDVPATAIDARHTLLQLGLDSLQLVELQSRLARRLGAAPAIETLFRAQSLAALAAELDRVQPVTPSADTQLRTPEVETDTLTPYQWAIWLKQQQTEAPIYNLAVAFEFEPHLDTGRIAAAHAQLLERHRHLRSHVVEGPAGELRWQPLDTPAAARLCALQCERVDGWSETQVDAALAAFRRRPFRLEQEPPLRAWLLERAGRGPLLALCMHHITTDFHGAGALVDELLRSVATPGDVLAPPAPAPHALLAEVATSAPAADEGWLDTLAAADADLDLGLPAPAAPGLLPLASVDRALPGDLVKALRDTARDTGSTLNVLLAAAFAALLHRYTGQDSLCLGMPFSVRPDTLLDWPGNAVNMVPLALRFSDADTLQTLTDQTTHAVAAGLRHRHLPLMQVAEGVRRRQPGRTQLFDAVFICQPERGGARQAAAALLAGSEAWRSSGQWPGLRVRSRQVTASAGQALLTLLVFPHADGARLALEYDPQRLPADFASRVLDHYAGLLRTFVRDPRQPIARADYLSADELALQWQAWNAAGHATPDTVRRTTLVELFQQQVAARPDAVAVLDASGSALRYAELATQARQWCAQLQRLGVGRGDCVGVALPRDRHLPAALLGVLMSGAAYVPLDLDYPAARLHHILDSSGARCVVTVPAQAQRFTASGRPCLFHDSTAASAEVRPVPLSPADPAYVLYTSGSTGQPKGVQVTHGNVVALLAWAYQALDESERARVLASTSVCFDLSVFEFFVPLCGGTTCVVVERILDLIESVPAPVTLINTVPSAIDALVAARAVPDSVLTALVAGEPFRQALVERLYAGSRVRRVLDLYGPTEDTVYSTCAERRPGGRETIGRPLPGTRAYLLDARQQPVPAGLPGELYLAGSGLSLGYRGRDDLTAEAFALPAALAHLEQRVYRTGDIVRYTAGGEIVYLGRRDHQVKVRGYRIELQEVEACLLRGDAVQEAVAHVVPSGQGHATLVAYVVWQGAGDDTVRQRELNAHLARQLPSYMRPSVIVTLAQLPRTLNGKVDRKALPTVQLADSRDATPLQPGLETELAALWGAVLGTTPTQRRDHFIELGGNSLSAVQLRTALKREWALDVPLAALIAVPVLADQAELLREMSARPAAADDTSGAATELEEVEL